MIPQELIDAILKEADIVTVISSYINVIKKGRSYLSICPFHDDKHPSMNISKEKQIFKCFSCGEGGNAITFIQKYEKISFEDAVRKLAEIIGFHDPRLEKRQKEDVDPSLKPLYQCIGDLQKYYVYALSIQEAEKAKAYLDKRNIDASQIERYAIGYSPLDGQNTIKYLQAKGHTPKTIEDIGIALIRLEGMSDHNNGRLIFPLHSPSGQVVGFSARRIEDDGTAKYINSPETPIFHKGQILYNYHNAVKTARRDGYCYLLEGFMDVMALEKAGLPNAVALMGTALTNDQIGLLKRLRCEIRLCLDGDAPGQMGMMKICMQLQRAGLSFRVVDPSNDTRDPDDILQQDGKEALKKRMETLLDPYDYQISYYINSKKLETSEDRMKVLSAFLPYLRSLPEGIEKEDFLIKLAKATGYEAAAIRNLLSKDKDEGMDLPSFTYGRQSNSQGKSSRLLSAEKTLLYYMLQSMDAISFFDKEVGSFYHQDLNAIANYIVDFSLHHESIDLSLLVGQIQGSMDKDADALSGRIAEISDMANMLPYNKAIAEKCQKAIAQGKEELQARLLTEKELEKSSSYRQSGESMQKLLEARRMSLGKDAKE